MTVEYAGRLKRQLVEVRTITDDVVGSFGSGVATLLLLVMAYFFYKHLQVRTGRRWSWRVAGSELLRAPVTALILGLPLLASLAWTFGLMPLLGLKLNFYNLVVLPTVLGIGDDSGIHIVHRYLEEGTGSVGRVLRSTGEHITMSAVTTMVGFGGLLLSLHPGLRSIGALAVLGISMTLVAALIVLPALLQWREEMTPSRPVQNDVRVRL